jgi:hypothetical protein
LPFRSRKKTADAIAEDRGGVEGEVKMEVRSSWAA